MKRPVLIGLTGSIGMGKSTTALMFADLGIPVWDADDAVSRLYAKGGEAVEPIRTVFPLVVEHDAVNKGALKAEIQKAPEVLKRLEEIVHPLVAQDRENFKKEHADQDMLVFDIPLLFETGQQNSYEKIVVVSVSAEIQKKRVMERKTMSEDMFLGILRRQMPDDKKRKRADYVIETDTIQNAQDKVVKIVDQIKEELVDA